uniref:BTB and MATH domain-containing protein 43 n=1 Tax=Lygus hesperus TaxID=30085 RepID=A0A0A9X5N5_LYGHE
MDFLDYTWNLTAQELREANSPLRSMSFRADTRGNLNATWYLKLYPKGHEGVETGFCPLYLMCEETNIYPLEASYFFTLVNSNNALDSVTARDTNVFEAGKGWGARTLIELRQVLDQDNGFLKKGRIFIKTELSYTLQKETKAN